MEFDSHDQDDWMTKVRDFHTEICGVDHESLESITLETTSPMSAPTYTPQMGGSPGREKLVFKFPTAGNDAGAAIDEIDPDAAISEMDPDADSDDPTTDDSSEEDAIGDSDVPVPVREFSMTRGVSVTSNAQGLTSLPTTGPSPTPPLNRDARMAARPPTLPSKPKAGGSMTRISSGAAMLDALPVVVPA
jgi:hypothetical protein